MYKWLGQLSGRHPWKVILTWLSCVLGLTLVAPNWDNHSQDDDIRFLPDRCASVRGYKLLEKAFPEELSASRLLFALERIEKPLTKTDFELIDRLVSDLRQLKNDQPSLGMNRISAYSDPFIGKRLLSNDGHCSLISVAISTPYLALQTRAVSETADALVQLQLKTHNTPGLQVYTTGPAGIGRDLINATAHGLDYTTVATVILVLLILLFVYRAPFLAAVPLVSIAISVVIALKILALCTLIPGFHLMNISQIFAVVMLYGAGTDYCLFLISRYREELTKGFSSELALMRAVRGVGSPLVGSAATVVCGLGMMLFAEFAKVRCGGPAIAISLVVALASSLTLAPAVLRILGSAAFWPLRMPTHEIETQRDLWTNLSDWVLRKPGWILIASLAILLPLAMVGIRVQPTYKATEEIASTSSSIQGLAAIQRHFNAGEVGPVTVLLDSIDDWQSTRGRQLLADLSRGFTCLDHVVEVRSLTQPLGDPTPPAKTIGNPNPLSGILLLMQNGLQDQIDQKISRHFLSEYRDSNGILHYVAKMEVVFGTDPFHPSSLPPLELIQHWLKERMSDANPQMTGLTTETIGVTVNVKDIQEVTEGDRLRINSLVLTAIFLILLILVRNPFLAGYLLFTVLFSYFVTLGATGIMSWLWFGRSVEEVDWRVPFFLFTILVAVGEDYNILLVTRAIEEKKRFGWRKGMQIALSQTGGTITSCGLIMAGTFATLIFAGLNTLVQIGFALAFGVLIDTFIIRPFVVPAAMVLMWSREDAEAGANETKRPLVNRYSRHRSHANPIETYRL